MNRKLYLSNSDKIISGVCGGIAEYMGIDSTLVRLITVILAIMSGIWLGVLVYFVAWAIVPKRPIF
ncbi:MAG: PspC domain-containing protein [Bacillota bacterium]